MTTSLNIHQKILGIMAEVKYVAKGDKTVNGQYRFVSHDAVTAKMHPMLVKYGITAIPSMQSISQEGNRTNVVLNVSFVNADRPEDQLTVAYPGYGIDNGDKGPGKAISYAFKYALLKTFCLETGEDPDQDANAVHEPEKCLEFDARLDEFDGENVQLMNKYLQYCATVSGKHTEDVKRAAVKKMSSFMDKFKEWEKKQ